MDWNVIDPLAKTVWEYSRLHQPLTKADAIVVAGSYNPVVAPHAAKLYLEGYAPRIVFSGGRSDSTSGWEKSEAETFAEIAESLGVPHGAILLETASTNSGENIRFTRELLNNLNIPVRRLIVVQKPYAERRAYAALAKQWPEVETIISTPDMTYDEYMDSSPIGKERSIRVMLGDLLRLKVYAEKGFQIPQEIPTDVWEAYEELSRLGLAKPTVE